VADWLFVWLLASGLTIALAAVALAQLTSSALQIGRAVRRFQDELGPLAADVKRATERARQHVGELGAGGDRPHR
jgi:hypothetical protein